ncbi:helix-turn-helix transcriptional regulator [Sphingomonas mucosissima]|uniref:Regulatory protein SoxS n=1 Tax=Sphingomonas mucosissima TaxID=370959 RepID=A0A245ZE59_9SPHN|nr:AraC family transcriptional regulator [Sphingomonas mucosissima]OWK27999.1 regulatory protein SoxS [Sphingomonas mucosissima]
MRTVGQHRVETLKLRDGVTLVLSDISSGEECAYHHVEPEDVFAIGFHLKGGSRFDMEGTRFDTKPLEVHAGAAPRAATSSFILPAHGFRTMSLRFAPEAAQELLARHGLRDSGLMSMVAQGAQAVSATRLAPLNQPGVAMLEAMFAAPYSGAGRSLFLESCALGLLAAQIDAAVPGTGESETSVPERGLGEALAYLDAHLNDPPTIVQLARIAGMNDFKLKRAFKAAFGTTVFGYVRQRRMERAAGDLHAGLSVAQAAGQAGYECPRCFSDAFRRHFGMLPSEVMRAALAETPARYG